MSRDRMAPRNAALAFLRGQRVMTAAAAGRLGSPWTAPVFYVNRGFDLYWLSSTRGRLASLLAEDARMAATVFSVGDTLESIRGLQVEGTGGLVQSPAERERVTKVYTRRHALFVERARLSDRGNPAGPQSDIRLFRLSPVRCWYTDNSRGFGWRVEIDMRSVRSLADNGR